MNKTEFHNSIMEMRTITLQKLLKKNKIPSKYDEVYSILKNKTNSETYNFFFKRHKKNFTYILYLFILIITLIGLISLSYFKEDYLLLILMKYGFNTSYLIQFNDIIDKLFLLFNEYYQSLIIYFSKINIKI